MYIKSLDIKNFRSFENSGFIELDKLNIFIGANNSGKSSILKAVHLMQSGSANPGPDVRLNSQRNRKYSAQISIGLSEISTVYWSYDVSHNDEALIIKVDVIDGVVQSIRHEFAGQNVDYIANTEPNHFIIPFFSKRKTSGYQEDVRDSHARMVSDNLMFLAAKLSRLGNSSFPGNDKYAQACKNILGFVVTAVPSANGQRPGVYLNDRQTLFIDQMGEGVPNIVGLLADLVLAEGKVFLIEEPENDLHPKALKALLDLILESSKSNQFLISTHSNIVVRYLASDPRSKLFSVKSEKEKLPPVAYVSQIDRTVSARLEVLRDLGYAFADFDLWDGWLILEESSAERIIRDYLIPWFVPKLSRIRTIAVGGTGNVTPSFEDFQRLVRFTHLENAYYGAVWVRVDGDDSGKDVISVLRSRYPTWRSNQFQSYNNAYFEKYYPREFADEIEQVLSIKEKKALRAAKLELLDKVRAWLDADELRGKKSLEISAAEILSDLKLIESGLFESVA